MLPWNVSWEDAASSLLVSGKPNAVVHWRRPDPEMHLSTKANPGAASHIMRSEARSTPPSPLSVDARRWTMVIVRWMEVMNRHRYNRYPAMNWNSLMASIPWRIQNELQMTLISLVLFGISYTGTDLIQMNVNIGESSFGILWAKVWIEGSTHIWLNEALKLFLVETYIIEKALKQSSKWKMNIATKKAPEISDPILTGTGAKLSVSAIVDEILWDPQVEPPRRRKLRHATLLNHPKRQFWTGLIPRTLRNRNHRFLLKDIEWIFCCAV